MKHLPTAVTPYKRTPTYTETSVPAGLLNEHSTKVGTWGLICVLSGSLRYEITSTGECYVLSTSVPGIIEPTVQHRVQAMGEVQFYVEFYR